MAIVPKSNIVPSAGQQKALAPIEQFRMDLASVRARIKSALPPHVEVDRFCAVMMMAASRDPNILNCDRTTLFNEAVLCASDGLLPDGRHAAFLPFKGKVKYVPMVKGLFKLIRQSGDVQTASSAVIYANERFKYWIDTTGEHVEYTPLLFEDRGERVGVFAFVVMKDGGLEVEAMNMSQVMSVKDKSAAKNSKESPWNGDFEDEMWRKTAVHRLCKRLDLTSEAEKALQVDEELYEMKPKTKAEQLNEKLESGSFGTMSVELNPGGGEFFPPAAAEKKPEPGAFDNFSGTTLETTSKSVDDPKYVK